MSEEQEQELEVLESIYPDELISMFHCSSMPPFPKKNESSLPQTAKERRP